MSLRAYEPLNVAVPNPGDRTSRLWFWNASSK